MNVNKNVNDTHMFDNNKIAILCIVFYIYWKYAFHLNNNKSIVQ